MWNQYSHENGFLMLFSSQENRKKNKNKKQNKKEKKKKKEPTAA